MIKEKKHKKKTYARILMEEAMLQNFQGKRKDKYIYIAFLFLFFREVPLSLTSCEIVFKILLNTLGYIWFFDK